MDAIAKSNTVHRNNMQSWNKPWLAWKRHGNIELNLENQALVNAGDKTSKHIRLVQFGSTPTQHASGALITKTSP